MPIRVLVVDDSRFYRARIEDMLRSDPDIEVVATAANGLEAVELAHRLKPDALTMDYEMPGLDGISAIEQILCERPVPILMLSAMSFKGASTTLKALDAGAADFLPKSADEQSLAQGASVLIDKIKSICANWSPGPHRSVGGFAQSASTSSTPTSTPASAPSSRSAPKSSALKSSASSLASRSTGSRSTESTRPARAQVKVADPLPHRPAAEKTLKREKTTKPLIQAASMVPKLEFRSNTKLSPNLRLVVIGASTGGPVAVQKILDKLPANFPLPIVCVLHMPASFTQAFAERLDQRSELRVRLACQNNELLPGYVYVAPGGMQTVFDRAKGLINVVQGDTSIPYKPCVDVTFSAAADVFGASVLGIVLTGMGADGREGALALQYSGSSVWVQDPDSCVVYGMPQAVMAADAADAELAIGQFAERLVEEVRRGRA